MKHDQKLAAIALRQRGYSINAIAGRLGVAKSSASIWVRHVELSPKDLARLQQAPYTSAAIEKRRLSRLASEKGARNKIVHSARSEISDVSRHDLWLMGVMLYWAEGGKTQRIVRFSNGDPRMIKLMMRFFREICLVPEEKFRGYIHIHSHLNHVKAEKYWSCITTIPLAQFFKTYRKASSDLPNKKNTLPMGVFDIYVMDTALFLRIKGWAEGIFDITEVNLLK